MEEIEAYLLQDGHPTVDCEGWTLRYMPDGYPTYPLGDGAKYRWIATRGGVVLGAVTLAILFDRIRRE